MTGQHEYVVRIGLQELVHYINEYMSASFDVKFVAYSNGSLSSEDIPVRCKFPFRLAAADKHGDYKGDCFSVLVDENRLSLRRRSDGRRDLEHFLKDSTDDE